MQKSTSYKSLGLFRTIPIRPPIASCEDRGKKAVFGPSISSSEARAQQAMIVPLNGQVTTFSREAIDRQITAS